MRDSADYIEPGLSLFSAVRHLERIADHATNVAEDVVYLVEGEIVHHRSEQLKVQN
jgi:phosphate transport system protein